MKEFDSAASVLKTKPEQLCRIVNLEQMPAESWNQQDLAAMWEHQMATLLDFDLKSAPLQGAAQVQRDEALASGAAAGIRSFHDLLFHPQPPLALLKLAKALFKRQAGQAQERRPEEQLAYLMYLLTISVARIRLRQAITKLSTSELKRGIDWGLQREWVDPATKALLSQFANYLAAPEPSVG